MASVQSSSMATPTGRRQGKLALKDRMADDGTRLRRRLHGGVVEGFWRRLGRRGRRRRRRRLS